MKKEKCAICGELNNPQDLLDCPECGRRVCPDCVGLGYVSCTDCFSEKIDITSNKIFAHLRHTPMQIELGLSACSLGPQCDKCSFATLDAGQPCDDILCSEALQYIMYLKSLCRSLQQRVLELEGGAGQW